MKKIIYQYLIKRKLGKNKKIIFGKGTQINKNCTIEGNNSFGNETIFFNSYIGFGSYISKNCRLNKIKIGKFCSIGQNVKNSIGRHPTNLFVSTHPSFFSTKKQAGFSFVKNNLFNEHLYVDHEKKFFNLIGNDVWIGNDVTIFDGVRIGDGSIIANGAIVTKDVEPYNIVGGVPAKLIKQRFSEKQIKYLLKFKWWNKDMSWIKNNINLFSDIEKFICKEKKDDFKA